MDQLDFEIRHADGRHERTAACAARVVIGSGAHCDVRLAAGQAAAEQVAIETLASGPVIRCLAQSPPTTLDGVPLAMLTLGPTATLRIGATHIQITRVAAALEAKTGGIGPVMVGKLTVVAGLVVAIFMMSRMKKDDGIEAPPHMPELFTKTATECPRTDPAEARAVADDQRASGDGARERSPFDPREARSSIKSYEIAAACYRLAQSPDAAEDAAQNARRMRDETLLDFRARRVRLERLLLVNDYELASQDVAVLRALTGDQQGEYSQWLVSVAQKIKNQQVEKTQ